MNDGTPFEGLETIWIIKQIKKKIAKDEVGHK
jgi:hypothetical protein